MQQPIPYWRLSAWYFCYFAFIGAFTPYFGVYLQSLGFSAWRISILLSLMQLLRLLAPNFWSWLTERTGRKTPVIRIASALSMGGFAGFFVTRDFSGLFVSMTLLAFFWSASLPLVEALTLGHLAANPERYGRIRLWGSVGFILTVMGVGLLLDFAPISSQLWVSWALLLGTLLSALTLTEANGRAGQAAGPILAVLRQRKVVFLLAAGLLMTGAHGALYVFYSIHLVAHGYGKTLVGFLWTLGVVAEIVVFLLMPRISAGVSLRNILLACFGLAVLRFLMIGWGVGFVGLLLLAQLLHGASFGAHHAATMAALNRWFEPGQQARAQALYGSVAFGAGGLGGALLAGVLWDRAGSAITFSAASTLALLGLILVWRGVPGDSAPAAVR